jgi:hypothetical protein
LPISVPSSIVQVSRNNRTNPNDSFYYLLESEDVNYAVESVIGCDSAAPSNPDPGAKFLILCFGTFDPRDDILQSTGQSLGINDIIMWDGNKWIVYLNTRNPKTSFGLIFDKQTKKFYHYIDLETGWLPILRSGSVDGGTFGS